MTTRSSSLHANYFDTLEHMEPHWFLKGFIWTVWYHSGCQSLKQLCPLFSHKTFHIYKILIKKIFKLREGSQN